MRAALRRFFSWDANRPKHGQSGEEVRDASARGAGGNSVGHNGSDASYGGRFTH